MLTLGSLLPRQVDRIEPINNDLEVEKVTLILKLNWTAQALGIVAVVLGKISVSVLLITVFGARKLWWYQAFLWVFAIAITTVLGFTSFILIFLQCRPASVLWDPRVKGICIDRDLWPVFGTVTGGKP
jgi:hypothetical protein